MTARRLALLALVAAAHAASAQTAPSPDAVVADAVVAGVVVGGDGAPAPYAVVVLVSGPGGAVTGDDGAFAFRTTATGEQTVEARMLGFETARTRLTLVPGDTARVRLVLREPRETLGEAIVTADAFVAGPGEVRGLSALDVVTTPGAAADLFRAIQTFPGLVEVDDGAGLFVRGGDASETVILLDGARLLQPYRFESPLGGVFGTVSPFLVGGTRFSTGGFSARYGNALSAVLALDGLDEPKQPARTATASLAAVSLSADQPFGGRLGGTVLERGGVRAAANRSFTDALFWVNGRAGEFETTPRSADGSLSVTVPYGVAGRVRAFVLASSDRLGVRVDEPSFSGVYRGSAASTLGLAEWHDVRGRWILNASASAARYASQRQLGALDLRPADAALRLRVDAEHELSPALHLVTGFEAERLRTTARGQVPLGGLYDPSATVRTLDEALAAGHGATWAEVEARPGRRVVVTAGLRADGHTLARSAALDPRLGAQVMVAPGTRLRLAWGLYSQFPDLQTYAEDAGAEPLGGPLGEPLGVQRAQHVVAGLLHERGPWTLRAEAYMKRYRRLALDVGDGVWDNAGRGSAHGLDLFARYGAVGETRWSGWASYTWLRARRTQLRRLGEASVLDEGPPAFGTPHTITLVGKGPLGRGVFGAVRLRGAAGRPYTPVTGAVLADIVQASAGSRLWLPVEGPVGSERLPLFARLDVQASRAVRVGRWGTLVAFAALNNALGRTNVAGYTYSADYSERTPDASAFGRSVYAGATLTF